MVERYYACGEKLGYVGREYVVLKRPPPEQKKPPERSKNYRAKDYGHGHGYGHDMVDTKVYTRLIPVSMGFFRGRLNPDVSYPPT